MKDLKIKYDKPENLIPYTNNNKHHSDDQILRLAGSIQAFGFDQPIVVDKNKVIIKGHARREAALKLKLKKVPIVIAEDLDDNQVKAARIADNKTSSNEYNMDAIKFDLGFLNTQDYNLNFTGIEPVELDILMKDNAIDDDFQKSVIGNFQDTGENKPNPVVGEVTRPEIKNSSRELDLNSFDNFKHECPKCGFEWDDSKKDLEDAQTN